MLWLDAATDSAVGLHFAGSNFPERGLAIDLPSVLEALEVDLVVERPAPERRVWAGAAVAAGAAAPAPARHAEEVLVAR